eukprot:1154773-Pelagomonas_calceolata.AAC.9
MQLLRLECAYKEAIPASRFIPCIQSKLPPSFSNILHMHARYNENCAMGALGLGGRDERST